MKFYHGTKRRFHSFRTPTGYEGWDIVRGGVIYLTSDIEIARKYAGRDGYIAVVEGEVRSYKEQLALQGRKKARKYVRNVFVGLASQLKIVDWL